MSDTDHQKLRAPGAAQYLGTSTSTMAKWRMNGTGPTYQKLGRRIVVYDRRDLEAFAAKGSRTSTLGEKDAA